MHPYHVILLIACVAGASLGTSVWMRDTRNKANRLATLLIWGGAYWAFCELLWNQAADAETALTLVKLSTLGWVWIGPVSLSLMIEIMGDSMPRSRVVLRTLYGAAVVYLLLTFLTPWVHESVVQTEWGWSYRLGPLYPGFYVITMTSILYGMECVRRGYPTWPSVAERRQAKGIAIGMLFPLLIASTTDGILPYFDVHVWHLGTTSLALMSLIIAITFSRYGYSLLTPGMYATEILETMPDGVVLLRLDGRIRRINPALRTMMGCADENALAGIHVSEVIHGFDLSMLGLRERQECTMEPLAGTHFPIEVSATMLRDRQNAPAGIVLVVHDLREVATLRQRLMVSGRMAAVGELAAGVAHEINNPMAYVRSNLSQLKRNWDDVARGRSSGAEEAPSLFAECGELIDESLEGVDRATSIIREIKSFSNAGTAERRPADIAALVDSTLRIAEPQIRHRAVVSARSETTRPALCSPGEIQQVLLNLLLNAVDAGEGHVDTADTPVEVRIEVREFQDTILLSVEDDGGGIDPDHIERIFDPFFTTKPAGKGTGLGLSLSYEIIRRHGGELRVASNPGQGATFTVVLPAAGTAEAAVE